MKFLPNFGRVTERWTSPKAFDSPEPRNDHADEGEESHLLKTLGWVSAALGAVALGLLVGRELRERYRFNHRTPYDLYAHSGDELLDVDLGVGI